MADVIESDLCVVGSGPTAQAVAFAAAAGSRSVLMLEAGRADAGARGWLHAMGLDTQLSSAEAPNPGEQVAIRAGGSASLPLISLTPGDRTGPGIRLVPMTGHDFGARPQLGLAGWPLGEEELAPYVERAWSFFGLPERPTGPEHVSGLTCRDFWCVDRRPISHPDVRTWSDRIQLRTDCAVESLSLDARGRAETVRVVGSDGVRKEVRFRDVVVAAGTYATTRILLQSGFSHPLLGVGLMDHPLLNLGRIDARRTEVLDRLRQFAPLRVGESVRWPTPVVEPSEAGVGASLWAIPSTGWSRGEPHPHSRALSAAQELADRFRAREFGGQTLRSAVRSMALGPELLGHVLEMRRARQSRWSLENNWWASETESLPSRFDLLAVVEQLPRAEHRVALSGKRSGGWARLSINWSWTSDDRCLVARSVDAMMGQIAQEIGPVKRVDERSHVRKFSCHHGSGTVRLGHSSSDGVVDPWGVSFDHPNLAVAGLATFPTVGFANPTLTAAALAFRLGERLGTA